MDEIKIGIARGRAAQAEAFLDNETVKSAFAAIDNELIEAWRNCTSAKGRDRIWQSLHYAEKFRAILKNVIANGKIAEKDLAWLNARRKAA